MRKLLRGVAVSRPTLSALLPSVLLVSKISFRILKLLLQIRTWFSLSGKAVHEDVTPTNRTARLTIIRGIMISSSYQDFDLVLTHVRCYPSTRWRSCKILAAVCRNLLKHSSSCTYEKKDHSERIVWTSEALRKAADSMMVI